MSSASPAPAVLPFGGVMAAWLEASFCPSARCFARYLCSAQPAHGTQHHPALGTHPVLCIPHLCSPRSLFACWEQHHSWAEGQKSELRGFLFVEVDFWQGLAVEKADPGAALNQV